MTVRLILGDQLNLQHSWFETPDDSILYFMAEMKQETNYVTHHIQKVVAFFASMRNFATQLEKQGHRVLYLPLDADENTQELTSNIQRIIATENAKRFEYLLPDEYRLDEQLRNFCKHLTIESKAFDTEHFLTTREELATFFKGKKQFTMEYFYRYMRKKHGILMLNGETPQGGQWNFDHSNRKKWKGTPNVPSLNETAINVSNLTALLESQNIKTIGTINAESFTWPTTRESSLEILNHFCQELLEHFGDYQDAMDPDEKYLFHSRLSFALNCKMISPKEVMETVIAHWRRNLDSIHISQVEGFVRQILGWREYMRGMYWKEMPNYAGLNILANTHPLPDFFWTGKTKMLCMRKSIEQSLENAYAHHIQRLMITGNYALLTQCDPDQVDEWYLGIYIDAIEWVEITNTRGMSQWADGGKIATKPYVSSGSYINKMSNYCKSCHYNVSDKTGEKACPFNSLYWNFLAEKRSHFEQNRRMGMMLNLLDKMKPELLHAHRERAQHIISNPNEY
ncbi:MAG: cryptochrome/photolyase family protein [Bacteroidota bacterium]